MDTQLIKNKELVLNDWFWVVPDTSNEEVKKQAGKVVQFKLTGEDFPSDGTLHNVILPEAEKVIVPLRLYLLKTDEIKNKYKEYGIWIYSHDELDLFNHLKEDINSFPVVGVYVEKFADGRIYSLGNLIRRKLSYKNDLRALGDVFKDQLFYLARSGFDSFLIKEGYDAKKALLGLEDFSYSYQGTLNQMPLWSER